MSSDFTAGFEKTAFIGTLARGAWTLGKGLVRGGVGLAGKVVGGGASLAGKAAKGVGNAVVKSQGGGVTGLVGTGLSAMGFADDMKSQMDKMKRAQSRLY